MKKVLFPILALVLALGLALPMAAGASPGPGLVGLWHLDEGSGQTAADATGVNDGQLGSTSGVDANDPTWEISGKFGNALSFDGIDDYVDCGNDASLNIVQGTWEAWLNFGAKPSVAGHLMNPLAKQEQYWIHASSDDSIQAKINVGGTRYIATTGAGFIETGVWYHVAGTYDGETLKLYVNGELKDSNTDPSGALATGTAILAIGTWSTPTDYFQGTIDEVRIWDEALTADQVAESYSLSKLELTKELVSPELEDTNENGIPEVPIATNITFTMNITIDNSATGLNLTAVMVKDRLGAELYLVSAINTTGAVDSRTKGNSAKWFIDWDIASLVSGDSATLNITAYTDINPGGGHKLHQEYTSPGIYELNSGATLTFCVEIAGEEICLVMTTDGLWVEAVGVEED